MESVCFGAWIWEASARSIADAYWVEPEYRESDSASAQRTSKFEWINASETILYFKAQYFPHQYHESNELKFCSYKITIRRNKKTHISNKSISPTLQKFSRHFLNYIDKKKNLIFTLSFIGFYCLIHCYEFWSGKEKTRVDLT